MSIPVRKTLWAGEASGRTVPANESLLLDLLQRNDVAELAQLIGKDAGLPSLELYMLRCEAAVKAPPA